MIWKYLKIEIESADKQINKYKERHTDFYHRQRMFWNGYKRGIGMAYKILKQIRINTDTDCKVLNIPFVSDNGTFSDVAVCDSCGKICDAGHTIFVCEDCGLNPEIIITN